jgi:hypothetical protein
MYQKKTKGPKRGITLFSYWGGCGALVDPEDCFQDIYDMLDNYLAHENSY